MTVLKGQIIPEFDSISRLILVRKLSLGFFQVGEGGHILSCPRYLLVHLRCFGESDSDKPIK